MFTSDIREQEILDYFKAILGVERVLTDRESLQQAGSDHTEDLVFLPEIVLQAQTTEEVSRILAYCNEHRLVITPRGAGTGLSGGCLPVQGSIVLDMRRMNQILEIDSENFQVTVEPGVITEVLQNAVQEHGLFYPVDPASKGSCFIGGNVAENSGGARALKYGVVKDYVLNLEIVLPDGSVMWTGANTLKNATGYNLTQLIVGSEGTLAVITKIVLKLLPQPTKDLLILVPFYSAEEACRAVNKVFLAGYDPSALEFMERDAILAAQKFIDDYSIPVPEEIQAHLLIEVNGNEETYLMQEIEGIVQVLEQFNTGEVLFADNQNDKDKLWRLRRVTGEAAKGSSVYKEEDTVVPRAKLPQLLAKVKALGKEYGFDSICYGHAGDGNLHVNIVKNNMPEDAWHNELPKAIRELFLYTKSLGGTLSGEHGIGYVQKQYMDIAFSAVALELMRQIKKVFDPNDILNPGKILPG
ncbi:MAG: FAD-binding oxidoreductase [Bacteroidetes bacterium 43-16]|nr:MAG: FAD-binding oxidoreductase [Bacteroidetes bacterium 43-16]